MRAKISLTLEEELLAEVRNVAGTRGLSGYVNRALRHQLQHDRLAILLAEYEQDDGPVDPRIMKEVRQEWPAPGEKNVKRRSA